MVKKLILTLSLLMVLAPTVVMAEGEENSTASAPAGIYIDQINGDDANDGFTKSTAVKTIEKANELAKENALKDIFLSSFYTVTGSEEWDLGGKTIHRYGLGGYMIIRKRYIISTYKRKISCD